MPADGMAAAVRPNGNSALPFSATQQRSYRKNYDAIS